MLIACNSFTEDPIGAESSNVTSKPAWGVDSVRVRSFGVHLPEPDVSFSLIQSKTKVVVVAIFLFLKKDFGTVGIRFQIASHSFSGRWYSTAITKAITKASQRGAPHVCRRIIRKSMRAPTRPGHRRKHDAGVRQLSIGWHTLPSRSSTFFWSQSSMAKRSSPPFHSGAGRFVGPTRASTTASTIVSALSVLS